MSVNKSNLGDESRSPEDHFPEWSDDIRRLRKTDAVFEEICHDFELMAGLLGQGRQQDEAVQESFAGLCEEIRLRLLRQSADE